MDPIATGKVSEQVDLNLREWLAAYFDGGEHAIGVGLSGVFPACELGFGVSQLSAPISGVSGAAITTIAEINEESMFLDGAGRVVCEDLQLAFVVRAKVNPSQPGNSRLTCQQTADLLHALLCHPDALLSLAEAGIYDLQPVARRILATPDYSTREVTARARLEYNTHQAEAE